MNAQMSALRDVIYGATEFGADLTSVCHELGLEPHELNDSEKFVTEDQAAKFWDVLLRHTKDPLLGLHLGERAGPTILGMIGYLMQSSSTVYESTIMLCKFNELYTPVIKFSGELTSENFFVHYDPSLSWQHLAPEGTRQAVEIGMSCALAITKTLTGKRIYPLRVELTYPPRLRHEYERIFQAPIHFNSKRNTLVFHKTDAAVPILSYDKSLFEFFNNTLAQKLKSLQGNELFSDKIKQLIINDFKGQTPSIEIASAKLNMTPRSLQRKLKEDNTSYRTIITDLKKELAQTIMGQSDFRVGEVAELLGYADSSSFRKAYKKWGLA
jgi:AraC-like DNA-binding protein